MQWLGRAKAELFQIFCVSSYVSSVVVSIVCCKYVSSISVWTTLGEETHVLRWMRHSDATGSGVLQQVREADRRSSLAGATAAGTSAGACSPAGSVLAWSLRV